jgi:hypothetical protein
MVDLGKMKNGSWMLVCATCAPHTHTHTHNTHNIKGGDQEIPRWSWKILNHETRLLIFFGNEIEIEIERDRVCLCVRERERERRE